MKKLILLIALFLTASCYSQAIDDRGYIVKTGDLAPQFKLTLTNGKQINLAALKGKVIMLQFTASWCGVCRKEMPFIERDIWQKHKDNPEFMLMAIDREEPLERVDSFANSIPITYPIGLDPNADIFAKYANREAGITRNVIIDKTGKIVFMTRLYKEAEFNEMTKVIDKLLE